MCAEKDVDKSNVINLFHKKYNHIIKTYKSFKAFKKYLNNNIFDIIHINVYNSVQLKLAHIASKYSNDVIVHAHNSNIDNDILKTKKIINKLYKVIYARDYRYIAVSKEASLFCFGNKKSTIISNRVDYNKTNMIVKRILY